MEQSRQICGNDATRKLLLHEVRDMVDEIADKELFINEILKPVKNGYLGSGGLSFAYNCVIIIIIILFLIIVKELNNKICFISIDYRHTDHRQNKQISRNEIYVTTIKICC